MNDLELVKEILPRLSPSRADSYESWLGVGMALYHAGASCEDWDSWSRSSAKYETGACEKKWKTFASSGSTVGMGSLVEWARADGFDPYAGQALDWGEIIEGESFLRQTSLCLSPQAELEHYLKAVFKSGESCNFVVKSYEKDGKYLPIGRGVVRNVGELLADISKYDELSYAVGDYDPKAGAWIRFNPVKGEGCKNEDIVEYRHVLVESDTLPIDDQIALIRRLNLPCAAIVNSGGKSVHAIVKVDAGDNYNLYRERVSYLFGVLERNGFIVDKACKNPSRLSRMPGVVRGDRRQFLVSVNEGCPSWAEWEADIKANDFDFRKLTFTDLFNTPLEDKSDNLLGNRFLTREGSWLIVAQSGVGKSVLAMQMAILFALGRDLWGLKPIKPLKVAIIQAENNKLDLVEPLRSICDNLGLSDADRRMLQSNFSVYPNSTECGKNFARLLERVAKDLTPDIVIVDPLLSYIGGDISKQDVCSSFLRNTVHPILQRYQMGLIVMHHTGKPRSKEEAVSGNALSYAGTGSSELTNYVRAVSTIFQNSDNPQVYDFTYSKRGKRAELNESVVYLKQGECGNIFWDEVEEPVKSVEGKSWRPHECDPLKLEEVIEPMSFGQLVERIQSLYKEHFETELSFKKAKSIISVFERNGRLIRNKDTKTYQGFYYGFNDAK